MVTWNDTQLCEERDSIEICRFASIFQYWMDHADYSSHTITQQMLTWMSCTPTLKTRQPGRQGCIDCKGVYWHRRNARGLDPFIVEYSACEGQKSVPVRELPYRTDPLTCGHYRVTELIRGSLYSCSTTPITTTPIATLHDMPRKVFADGWWASRCSSW
jgi:hypothetical protein